MKIVLCVFLCATAAVKASCDNDFYDKYKQDWINYKNEFQKKYDTEVEDNLRFKIFVERKLDIEEHNEKYKKGEVSYAKGINQFSDKLSHETGGGCFKLPDFVTNPKPQFVRVQNVTSQ